VHAKVVQALLFACALGAARPCWAQGPDTARAVPARSDSMSRRTADLLPVVVAGTRLSHSRDRQIPTRTDALALHAVAPGAAGAAEALLRLTGVSISNDQGTRVQPTLQLRGFTLSPVVGTAQGLSVFLDGVRINEPDAQELYFDLVPFDALESAELIRGPTAIHGKNTLGGALDLVTMRGGAPAVAEAEVGGGSYGAIETRATLSGIRGDVDGLLMVRTSRDNGYQMQSGSRILQLFSTIGRRSDSGDVALSLLIAGSRVFQAGSLPESWLRTDRRANYTGGDFSRPALTQLTLRASHSLAGIALRGNVFARRNAIEQYNVNVSDPNSRAFVTNQSGGASGELAATAYLFGRDIALALGAEYAHSAVSYRLLAERSDVAPALPPGCDSDGLCEDARVPGDDAALYAQALLRATPRVSFLLSARGDYVRIPFQDRRDASNDGTNVFRQLSPMLGVTFTPSATSRVYASFGAGFRAPAALELACASPEAACPLPFSLGADPPLRPVVAWNRELGGDWTSPAGTTATLSFFRSDVRDDIAFVTSRSASGYFQNIARTRRQGLEATAGVLLPHAVRLRGSYAYVDATYRSSATLASALTGNDVEPGSVFPISPRHRTSADVETVRALGAFLVDATFTVRAVSSQFLRGDEANRMEPMAGYTVADLRLQLERGRLSVHVAASNVFNRRYALYGVYADNPKGAPGSSPSRTTSVERFFTPAYPRTVSLALAVRH
jgi:iron complex outermembrane receptor protein